jgi:hypothetical protein
MTKVEQIALEKAQVLDRGQSWAHWKAMLLNRLFDSLGQRDKKGNRPASDIRPDTVRDGEKYA